MESFSWSDSLCALAAPCLSCLRTPKSERNDLEDLLVDSGSGTTDAETLSLHSNPGSPRRKRTRFTKNIRLFGWNLFGRPPIRLPDDDEDDDEEAEGARAGSSKRSRRRPPPPAISSSTLDSDAAPLDSAAIETHATKRAEEEAKRAERRARRHERKEKKRAAALALALEHAADIDGNAEFEGFPGSGGRLPQFARGEAGYRDDNDDEDEDEDEGDFGGGAYAHRTRGGSDSGRGSDSRSRTSTSLSSSGAQPYNHHYISQQPSAAPPPTQTAPTLPAQRIKKGKSSRSSASKTSSSSRRSHSSPSASQSPSLVSPVATQFLDTAPAPPRATQRFEGVPNDLGLHTAGIERLSSGFPSPGFGGPRNGKRDMGAFLANRGDA